MNDEEWNKIKAKESLAKETGCPNLNLYLDNKEQALILIKQKWTDGFMRYKPEMEGPHKIPWWDGTTPHVGEDGLEHLAKILQDFKNGDNYENAKAKEGSNITDLKDRLHASRMWYWHDEVHRYVEGSAAIRQGRDGSYADGDISFKLRAYKKTPEGSKLT